MQLAVAFGASSLFSGTSLLKMGLLGASAVGSYLLSPKRNSDKGKLNDLRISASTYGRGLGIVYGTMRCSGNMFWATDLVEEKRYLNSKGKDVTGKKKDSKKGSSKKGGSTVYQYYANFAMGLCEGEIDSVIRVWADGNLIYDKYASGTYDPNSGIAYDPNDPNKPDVIVKPGFSNVRDGGKTGKGNNKKGVTVGGTFDFRFYSGSETQQQDSFMIDKQGVSKVPAFRGLCYLMFEDFPLTDFGNRIPTITAEVSARKNPVVNIGTLTNLDATIGWNSDDSVFFDPSRLRLYHVRVDNIRVFDLTTNTEIKRVTYADMGVSGSKMIGVGVQGEIVTSDGGNSGPIHIIDANTFQLIRSIGIYSNDVYVTHYPITKQNALGHPIKVYPCLTYDLEGNTVSLNAVVSQFNDITLFTSDWGGITSLHTNTDGGITNSGCSVIPGLPGISATNLFIKTGRSDGDSVLWKFEMDSPVTSTDISGDSDWNVKDISAGNGLTEIYRSVLGPTDSGVGLSDPFAVISAECVAIFETINSTDTARNGCYVVALDVTGNLIWREKITDNPDDAPDNFHSQLLPAQIGNTFYWRSLSTIYTIDFQSQDISSFSLPADIPTYVAGQLCWASDGSIMMAITDGSEMKFAMLYVDRLAQTQVSAAYILADLADRVGLKTSQIDLTQLDNQQVTGVLIENPESARTVVDDLGRVFMFDVVESDYKIKVVSRGKSPIVTIPQDDLGVVQVSSPGVTGGNDYYKESRVQEIDLPERVNVSFIDPGNKYQVGTAHYKRPRSPNPVVQTREALDINLPIAMTPSAAKQTAQKICLSVWSERVTHEFVLPWTYLKYDPADVATFSMNNGLSFQDRIIQADFGADYTIQAKGISQIAAAYSSVITQAAPGGVIAVPRPSSTSTKPFIFDVPFLHDTDVSVAAGFEYYWGIGAFIQGFGYASISERVSGDTSYDGIGSTGVENIWGRVKGVVSPPANGSFATDDKTKIILIPEHDYSDIGITWESIPDSSWPSDANCLIIGNEVIYFRDAAVNSDGSVTVSHLIRGARGTEQAAYEHRVGEYFSFLTVGGIHTATDALSAIGKTISWITQSPGLFGLLTFPVTKKLTGATLKPYAPNGLKRTEASGNITVTWQRRTRYDGELLDNTGTVPLNEDSEEYEVYLLAGPFDPDTFDASNSATYVRAYTGLTTNILTYASADMTTDGFSITDTLYLVAFQVSAQVGRGFPGAAMLEHRFYP